MDITYAQALELVRSSLGPSWTGGTFCIDDRQIVETDAMYVFDVGAREFLKDDDLRFATMGGVTVVYKQDGRLATLPSVQVAMDPTVQRRDNPAPTFR